MQVNLKGNDYHVLNRSFSHRKDTPTTPSHVALSTFRLIGCKRIISAHGIPVEYKATYFHLFCLLTQQLKNEIFFNEYITNLEKLLDVDKTTKNKNYRMLAKKHNFIQKGISKTYIHIYSLILESGFLLSVQSNFDADGWLENLKRSFGLKGKAIKWFKKYFSILKSDNYENLQLHCKSIKDIPYLRRSIKHMSKAILQILKHERFVQKHIAVISTMSSGKSTFINALIGNEIFPETQAACTAKITSIYDNDRLNHVNGIALYGDEIKQVKIAADKETAKKWNDDSSIDKIVFEGNLKNVFNHNQIIAVHDTPGTNFSSDEEHKKITLDFLENTKLNAIICLINAMYVGTNDLLEILRKVRKISEDKGIKVLFVLNKIDAMDEKKENLSDVIKKAREFIESIGFKEPLLITTSAKAVRLFKMALEGMAGQFSEDEEDDFGIFLRKFLKEKIDRKSEQKLIIGEKEYFKDDVINALKNTGFHIIEKIINKGE